MAASFSPNASARLFWLDVGIAARNAGRWHDRHFVAGRRRRDAHFGIDVARRMDDATGAIEPLTEILISRMRLGIKLAWRILISCCA